MAIAQTKPLGEYLNPLGSLLKPVAPLEASQAFKGASKQKSEHVAQSTPATMPKLGFGGVSTIQQFYPETGTTISPEILAKAKEIAPTFKQQTPKPQPVQTNNVAKTSIVPTASAESAIDTSIAEQAVADLYKGMPIEEFDSIYPELTQNKAIFEQLAIDIKAGMPIDEAKNVYPELYGSVTQEQPTVAEPTKQEDQSFLGGVAEKTVDVFKLGIGKIQRAGEQLASGEISPASAAIRGGAAALESAFSPIAGIVGQTAESGFKALPEKTQESIKSTVTPIIERAVQAYEAEPPEQKERLKDIMAATEVLGAIVGAKPLQQSISKIGKVGKQIKTGVSKLEEVAGKATTPKSIRLSAETGEVLPPIKPVTKATQDLSKSNDLISRGLKPSVTGKDTGAKIEVFQSKIREGIESVAKTRGNASDGIDALKKAGERKKEIFETIKNNNDFVTKKTTGKEIASKIEDYMNSEEYKLLENTNPGLEKKLNEYLTIYKKQGKEFTQDQLQTLKTNQNKKIPATSWAEMLTTDKDAVLADSTIARILGETIDDNVSAVLGNTNKALNREYGAVRELEKNLARRMGVFQRNTKGGLTGLTDIFSLPEIAIGALTGDVKQVAKGVLQKTIATAIRDKENPNRIVKELFKLHGKKEGVIQKSLGLSDKSVSLKPNNPTNGNISTNSNSTSTSIRGVRGKGDIQDTARDARTPRISIAEEKRKARIKQKPRIDLQEEIKKAKKVNPLDLSKNKKGFINPKAIISDTKKSVFGKNEDNILYHTSSVELPKKLSDDKILWATKDREYSRKYGKEGSRKTYSFDSSNLNIIDGYSKEGVELAKKINKLLPKNKQFSEVTNPDGGVSSFFIQDKEVVKKLRELGYDAIRTSESVKGGVDSVGIINPAKLKAIVEDLGVIPKELEPLAKEARKYKSVQDFINAQGEPLYHGTNYNGELSPKSPKNAPGNIEGIYLTPDKSYASEYGNVREFYTKLKNPYKGDPNEFYAKEKGIDIPTFGSKKEVWEEYKKVTPDKVKRFLISKGYDGVVRDTYQGPEVIAFEKSSVISKDKLIDIFNSLKKPR